MQIMHYYGLVVIFLAGYCLAEELLELSCSSDVQCLQFERGRCLNSTCHCTARDSGQRVDCRPMVQKVTNIIGGHCPCPQRHAECNKQLQQCTCSSGFMPSEDKRRCLAEKVALNEPCEFPRQCQLADKFSTCQPIQNRCLCRNSFESHQGHCLAVLESNCVNDTDCGSSGASLCLPQLKKCGCAVHYVHNRNMTKCITGSNYGDDCETSTVCQATLGSGGQCQEHRCNCRSTHYPRKVANTVPKEEEAVDTHLEPERISCEPTVPFGAYCRTDSDCQMHPLMAEDEPQKPPPPFAMECKWGECRCSAHHSVRENQCVLESAGSSRVPTTLWIGLLLHISLILY
ncbi:cell death abnormality protein 1 [Drosophila obscura]|uniref:cell death abnormality protein 1 n=1 Tax=Drosophila obscura TaxID=7282 RepID=UPI000B9FB342|nr:cell death abnormality protein 1 [Drosophila obscura]